MSGFAHVEDNEFLKPGAPCIIKVPDGYFLAGLWWGTVIEQKFGDGKIFLIEAQISGGRLTFNKMGVPIRSDEAKGNIPSCNYDVFFDTGSVREILGELIQTREELKKANAKAEHWRQMHIDVMKNIAKHLKKMTEVAKTVISKL